MMFEYVPVGQTVHVETQPNVPGGQALIMTKPSVFT
jgi:hypothetical protein